MKYKTTQKDRYGNMRSLEIETDGNNLEVPPMGSGIPQYEAVGGLAENHPGAPKGSDTVPAWLTPGEFVVNKEAVDMYGPQIKKMNDAGREVQDGNMNPNQAPPMYASTGKEVEDRKIKIYKHLANEWGLPDNQIAAVMGQIYHESDKSFNPFRLEDNVPEYKRGEGLFQNTPGNSRMLKPYHEYLIGEGIIPKESILIGGSDLLRDKMTEDQAIKSQLDFFMKSFMDFGETTFDKKGKPITSVLDATNPVTAHGWEKANLMKDAFADTDLRTLAVKADSNPSLTGGLTSFINVPNDALDARNIATEKMLKEINSGKYSDYNYQEDLGNMPTAMLGSVPSIQDPSQIPDGGLIVKDIPRPLGSDQSLGDAVMDKVQGGFNIVRDKAGNVINWVGDTATDIHNVLHPTQEEMGWKNKGGPIHAYDGMQIPLTRGGGTPWYNNPNVNLWPWGKEKTDEEKYLETLEDQLGSSLPFGYGTQSSGFDYGDQMVPPVYTDPSEVPEELVPGDVQEIEDVVEPSVFNPWDYEAGMTYKYPYSYPEVGSAQSIPVPSGVDHGFQKELDKKILDNVDSFNLPKEETSASSINMKRNFPQNKYGPRGFSGYPEVPTIENNNIPINNNVPIPEIDALNDIQPGPFTGALGADEEDRAPLIPPMPGEDIIVDDRTEDYRPSGFVPTMLDANPNTVTEDLQLGNIAELEAEYQDAVNTAMLSNPDDPDFKAKQAYVKKAKEKLDAAKSGHKILDAYRDVAPQFGGEPQWIKDAEIRNLIADEQATIDELKARLNDPSLPEEYKEAIKGRIAKIQESIDAKAAEVQVESQNKLAELGSKIDNATEAEIKSKLDSEQGQKVLDEKENKDDNDPEVSKTRQMFDFLFGDLIDGGEIGRAISVYLASRALGYNHDGSIGFVAKQYLKRVDAKNAQMDKWILANSHLYTKDSLANFKRTKDPSKLIRIGASPRSTGKKEMQYHKELGQMMAYEFKVKNTAGDDITYWSFDINGLKPELRVGSGWSDKNVNDVSLETIGQVNKVLTGIHTARDKHTTGSKDNKKTVYRSGKGSTPGIIPDAIAGETAQWLFDRDIPPGKFLQPLDDAYAALIASNQKLLKDDEDAVLHTSIIPFLEDATIKLRLENMMYKDKDGKMRPLPSPIKAIVNGKERTMTNEDLVRIQQRIESVYTAAKSDIFWAEIAAQWKKEAHEDFQDDPKKKKTWREVFMKMAKEKDNAAYTPFGLFAESIIENEIADIGTSLQP